MFSGEAANTNLIELIVIRPDLKIKLLIVHTVDKHKKHYTTQMHLKLCLFHYQIKLKLPFSHWHTEKCLVNIDEIS